MNQLKLLLTLLPLAFSLQGMAQGSGLRTANKQFENLAYSEAIDTYMEVAGRGYKSRELFEKIGDSYYFNGKLADAYQWYDKLFELGKEVPTEYYYRFAQTLKFVGKYSKADEIMEQFAKLNDEDSRGKLFLENKDYLDEIEEESDRYEIKLLKANSSQSDYGTAFFGDKIVFASSREPQIKQKKVDKWTNQSFTCLYSTVMDEKDSLAGKSEKFAINLDTKFHESTPVFTSDLNTVYFTRNNYNNGKAQKDENNRILLKIYRAEYNGSEWVNVTELPFNSNDYSCAHPSISADGSTLYFASNMPGGYGESDIYKVNIKGGSFGTPVNLGPGINTEARESFPFISAGKDLYFSSEGHPGLGGLDIFISRPEADGTYQKSHNVGTPVNSMQDDFALIINDKTRTGYFTSNRDGGKGFDDIYSFIEFSPYGEDCARKTEGILADEISGKILVNTKAVLLDANLKVVNEAITDDKGWYSFDILCGRTYYVRPADYNKPKNKEEKKPEGLQKGADLAKVYNIEYTYFDRGKFNITPEAEKDLKKLADFLKQNTNAKVDVRTHTDSRASNAYNQVLSDKRAKAIIDYLLAQGIESNRVTGKGYGETQMINKCADGVSCSEEQHGLNRRSEFIITEL